MSYPGYGTPEWVGELLQELDARQAQRASGYQQQYDEQQQQPQAPELSEEKRVAELAKWDSLRSNPEMW
jgi:hypothetical protein